MRSVLLCALKGEKMLSIAPYLTHEEIKKHYSVAKERHAEGSSPALANLSQK